MLPPMNPAGPSRGNESPEDPFVPDLSEGAEAGVYLALLELIDEGLIITGDERIIDANSAACSLLEREYREVAGRPLADLFPNERAFLDARARLLIQGEMRGSLRIALPGGRQRNFRFVAAARLRPGIHALILSPDLLAETAADSVEPTPASPSADDVWPRLAAALAQPVIVIDHQGRINAANSAALTSLRMRRSEMVGQDAAACLNISWPAVDAPPLATLTPPGHAGTVQARVLAGPRAHWRLLVLPPTLADQTLSTTAVVMPPRAQGKGDRLQPLIESARLELHFQPLINSRSGAIHAGEALLRWHHPLDGLTPFRRFAELARDGGQLPELGGWALRTACRAATNWPTTQRRSPTVTVNIAIEQITHGALVQQVISALSESGLDPQRLELDLDEQVLAIDDREIASTLQALAALGVRLAIDDFGRGLMSIVRLKHFPVDALKLDPALVGTIGKKDESDAMVEAIVCMAAPLGIKVLARGVESEAQQSFLLALGCDLQQGPLFGQPMTERDFADFLSGQLFC